MNKHFFKALLLSLSLIFGLMGQVEAARLGGGRTLGRTPSAPMQRQAAPVQQTQKQTLAPSLLFA